MENEPIKNGWTLDLYYGGELAFRHIKCTKAKKMLARRDNTWVVETINGTLAESELEESVHHNRYFFDSLTDAIGASVKVGLARVDEDVVDIRLATKEELEERRAARDVLGRIIDFEPPTVSEEELQNLGE